MRFSLTNIICLSILFSALILSHIKNYWFKRTYNDVASFSTMKIYKIILIIIYINKKSDYVINLLYYVLSIINNYLLKHASFLIIFNLLSKRAKADSNMKDTLQIIVIWILLFLPAWIKCKIWNLTELCCCLCVCSRIRVFIYIFFWKYNVDTIKFCLDTRKKELHISYFKDHINNNKYKT